MNSVAIVQEFRDKPSKKNASLDKRTCEHSDCTTILSSYNFTSYCSLHERIYANPKSFI